MEKKCKKKKKKRGKSEMSLSTKLSTFADNN